MPQGTVVEQQAAANISQVNLFISNTVSYTHLTLPTIYSV